MMAHDNYQRLMSQALDGQLSPADETELMRHLDECAPCRVTWEAMSGLDDLFAGAALASPAQGFSARVMARVETRRAGRRWMETILWLVLVGLLVAMAILPPPTAGQYVALPDPIARLVEQVEPGLEVMRTVRVAFGALLDGMRMWLAYVASFPVAWALGLTTLALAATWLGLVGVFGSGQGDGSRVLSDQLL